jgi:hypothetical protein
LDTAIGNPSIFIPILLDTDITVAFSQGTTPHPTSFLFVIHPRPSFVTASDDAFCFDFLLSSSLNTYIHPLVCFSTSSAQVRGYKK